MSKKRKSKYKAYVMHPRYGDKPLYAGNKFSLEEILSAYWGYQRETVFPETAIKADTDKQNHSGFPRGLYVDIEKQRVQCQRWFIFYAQEQKYWYETLSFYIDVDCVKCVDCRKKMQAIKQLMLDYERLVKMKTRTEDETKALKHTALELFQLGYIKDRQKVDNID